VVSIREDQHRDVPASDSVHQFEKPSARVLRSAARFFDAFDVRRTFRHHKRFQRVVLVEHIGRLCGAADAASGADALDGYAAWRSPRTSRNCDSVERQQFPAAPSGGITRPSRFQRCTVLTETPGSFAAFPMPAALFNNHHYTLLTTKVDTRG
jgi:hypothetical protein